MTPPLLSVPVAPPDISIASTSPPGSVDPCEAIATPGSIPPEKPTLRQEFGIFLSTFLTVLVAEVGDKTQVTTLLMSAESKAPWMVFAGAGMALIATSFLGVTVGCWLARKIPPKTLEMMAGALLLFIAVTLLWDVAHL